MAVERQEYAGGLKAAASETKTGYFFQKFSRICLLLKDDDRATPKLYVFFTRTRTKPKTSDKLKMSSMKGVMIHMTEEGPPFTSPAYLERFDDESSMPPLAILKPDEGDAPRIIQLLGPRLCSGRPAKLGRAARPVEGGRDLFHGLAGLFPLLNAFLSPWLRQSPPAGVRQDGGALFPAAVAGFHGRNGATASVRAAPWHA